MSSFARAHCRFLQLLGFLLLASLLAVPKAALAEDSESEKIQETIMWVKKMKGSVTADPSDPDKVLTVDLSGSKVKSIDPLSDFPNLTKLDLSNTRVTDLSPLSKFTKLEQLRLSRSPIDIKEELKGLLEKRQKKIDEAKPLKERLSDLVTRKKNRRNFKKIDNQKKKVRAKLDVIRQAVEKQNVVIKERMAELKLTKKQASDAEVQKLQDTLPKLDVIRG